ncbi:Type III secretion outermembrane pore forming protein (YscC,MxiD,HrcC, InvG) [Candidatus Rhodobacter oscarellae]|uniref:Type III secretion outermembrane pore forming protein (YscC,MxiD,HrcC, InvG) n=1 Tax=Candidatus Rhodobacter oscarellae TaxID=1675527 RepID=A0A0J9E0C4_9RHOB|nr:hypothetical protein [Candidatus Rhodobacter lobularis]KMW56386.1 Type III secretion outermembrane pore forming protein (YscC,MxiD,HrcC, InvG) [Candidatus Rhodobacter lobularis]
MIAHASKLAAFSAAALLCASQLASAQSEVLDTAYPKIVLDQDVDVVMREFSKDLDVTVVVDRELSGSVRQMDPNLSARRFLDRVANALSATWFHSNGYIYMTPLSDVEQIVFNVARVDQSELDHALSSLEQQGARPILMYGPGGRIAFASGAPNLLRIVKEIVELEGGRIVDDEPEAQVATIEDPKGITIFRGRVAQ